MPAVAAVLQLVTLPFCPESPSWLYITKKNPEDSRKALQSFGGAFNVDEQLAGYQGEVDDLEKRPEVRRQGHYLFALPK